VLSLLWLRPFLPAQVSNAQVAKLARLAAGRPADTLGSSSNGNGNGSSHASSALVMDDFRHTADQAYAAVDVSDSVIDILAELRCYLQDKCEPPIYVSDRRFMKAVQMLQVSQCFDTDCCFATCKLEPAAALLLRHLVSCWQGLPLPLGCVLQ
jgi:hypothetical protein